MKVDLLEKKLDLICRFGGHPVVKPAPQGAATFDVMIVVYLDEFHRRLYQVHLFNSVTGEIIGTF